MTRTSRDKQKNTVREHLRLNAYGRENAIGKGSLSFTCGISERNIRHVINELIDEGYPVCSAVHEPAGYYLPRDRDEAQEAINTLTSYARELETRKRHLERNVEQMEIEPAQQKLAI